MRRIPVYLLLFLSAACRPAAPPYAAGPALPDTVRTATRSPVVVGDSVYFLFRGSASTVHWNGDFNAWGRADSIPNTGVRVDSTLWVFATCFPSDLRTDYKIVVDSTDWILDPMNPMRQWGGAGPNSELRMPLWMPSAVDDRSTDRTGRLLGPYTVRSASMGYAIRYQVWLPHGFTTAERYPTLYVTDGHEYIDMNLGNLIHAAEVLMADGKVAPFVIVAVDPRDPGDLSRNRRMSELDANPDYAAFLTRELPATIERQFPVRRDRDGRALLGTSMGGLFATYVYAAHPGYFGHYAVQSPAYWVYPEIFDLARKVEGPAVRMVLTAGTLFDGLDNTRRMKAVLDGKPVDLLYAEANEGHSWGFWRARIPDILIHFFAHEPNP